MRTVITIALLLTSGCAHLSDEEIFREVSECVGVVAPMPVVHRAAVWPHTLAQSGAIYTDASDATLRHELVHYLLHHGGVPLKKNAGHDHPAFNQCALTLRLTAQ